MQLTLALPNPLAERFGKQHKDVLKAIKKLLAELPDPEFGRRNFAPSSYLNELITALADHLATKKGQVDGA